MKVIHSFLLFILLSCSLLPSKKSSPYEAFGRQYMISSQGPLSTKAGKAIFEKGGNAVDAAIAVSFALSVERPQSTGLGGGGFLLLKHPQKKEPYAFDFREMAPMASFEKMYLDEEDQEIKGKSLNGPLSAGVPGLVAGLMTIHKQFGKLPLKVVMAPAIKMAEKGIILYPHLAKAIEAKKNILGQYPSSKKIFFKKGRPLRRGETLIQKDLGKTLRIISQQGHRGFYQGIVAKKIVLENQKAGGIMSQKDLSSYKVRHRKPVKGTFKGHDIFSMGPPSSGGIHILQILNILEQDPLKKLGFGSPQAIHLISSAMQMAFVDRARYLGDEDFVKVPTQKLISKDYAKALRQKIDPLKAKSFEGAKEKTPFPYESDETTHFTIMDSSGMVISSTQTINGWMGSGFVVEGTGILLNNEMDDFATKVGAKNLFGAIGGENNLITPKKRPLSSMSPTIILKDSKPFLALGTPSGTRILTCVAQTILNYMSFEKGLFESVSATRFHHQWFPDEIRMGSSSFSGETLKELKNMGYKIRQRPLGCKVQAISVEGDLLHGVSDPRGEGLSLGERRAF
jgi:gamma-glutamyltranspeptidase/glutathione hydrolase